MVVQIILISRVAFLKVGKLFCGEMDASIVHDVLERGLRYYALLMWVLGLKGTQDYCPLNCKL